SDDISITVDQNIEPQFEIYSCASNKAQMRVKDNNYDQYLIDFTNDGIAEYVLPFSNSILAGPHSYGSSGAKTITVRGRDLNSADNCANVMQSFNAINSLPPTTITTLTSTDATNIKLDFSTAANIQYRSEIGVNSSSSFQLYQTVFGVNTLAVPNLKVDDNYYCFRLSSYDPCANQNTYSNTICSQDFDLNIKSGINTLNWTTSTSGISSMTFVRKKNNVTDLTLTRPGASPLSIDDTDAICKIDYCYTLTSNYSNGAKSISLEKCGTAFNTNVPPAIDNISSVVNDPGVALSWQLDPTILTADFNVFRSQFSGQSVFVGETPDKKFNDPSYQTNFNFCYVVNYSDICGNLSTAGESICPVRLNGALDKKNIISLNWSSYTGWKQGVKNYTVEKYGLGGLLINKFDVGTDTIFVDDQPDPKNQFVAYKVIANSNEAGISTSISNSLSFVKETHLISPTAFTPNGDNLNDTFTVTGEFIVKIELNLFDRWGTLIFTTEKSEAWDGKRNGVTLPEGAYIWKADMVNLAGQSYNQSGTVMLLSK
ncbi:MAG: gliding motility-associated C-terminal domain-containing protein, partial [Bacteroidia bacterium]|nr:gliding motility-associated C-terminal domain-containing protein [Bacteroidia bacterium]